MKYDFLYYFWSNWCNSSVFVLCVVVSLYLFFSHSVFLDIVVSCWLSILIFQSYICVDDVRPMIHIQLLSHHIHPTFHPALLNIIYFWSLCSFPHLSTLVYVHLGAVSQTGKHRSHVASPLPAGAQEMLSDFERGPGLSGRFRPVHLTYLSFPSILVSRVCFLRVKSGETH